MACRHTFHLHPTRNMPLQPNEIQPGLPVRHRQQPGQVGILTGAQQPSVVLMVEVKWSNETRYEPIIVLERFGLDEDDSFEGLVRASRYEHIESFRSLMTFEKLTGSLSNVLYSMQTAEIRFFAHQFVPVLKFINAPLGRLLIADEVGLGKTIEAGLVWTECRARYKARRLLVICPPTLVPKWIRELQDRFNIEAEYADAEKLNNSFNRFQQRPSSQSFAWVSSYHALRPRRAERKQLRPWLQNDGAEIHADKGGDPSDWKPRPTLFRNLLEWEGEPFINLVVFDEAHLMKNTATANHLVGDVLASCSQNVLGLSATPLTTKTRDLYALLKLVDPDMFRDEALFNDLCERNRPAVKLVTELSKATIDRDGCVKLLAQLPASSAQRHLLARIRNMSNLDGMEEDERIELRGKAMRLNQLGTYLTRTRKVEITEGKALRDAVTLDVHPTVEETTFYNAVLRLIRQRVADRGDTLSLFHLIGPALSMTSCLPVMAEKLRSGESRWGDIGDLATLENAYSEQDDEDADFVGEDSSALLDGLRALPSFDFEAADTKYRSLQQELFTRLRGQGNDEKVIIFAFFKATLAYLRRRLEADGLSCLMVTGDITNTHERDELLQRFRDPQYQVLLCSEVAAEGVDLQFCRVMVNYDLPWNPMRVEQRIGRIDRIGQQAKTIVIINFNVRGTIDGSVYQHLHSKIGIFQDTIGDLEGIVGNHVNKLTLELLSNELSPEQADERIRLAAEAIARERATVANLAEESDSLLGLRTYLQNSINQCRDLGRYIKPSELRLFATHFFQETFVGNESCELCWDTPADKCLRLTLSFQAFDKFESYLNQNNYPWPRGFERHTRSVTLAFDPDIHEKLRPRHRNLILVNHLHPFVTWMTAAYVSGKKKWHPASAIRVETNVVKEGIYFYMVMRASFKHRELSRDELLWRACDTSSRRTLPMGDSEALINAAMEDLGGYSWTHAGGLPDCSDALAAISRVLQDDCKHVHETFAEELELRLNSKEAQVISHFNRRLEITRKRIETMRMTGQRAQYINAAESQIASLQQRLEEETQKLRDSSEAAPSYKRVACGLIKVSRSNP